MRFICWLVLQRVHTCLPLCVHLSACARAWHKAKCYTFLYWCFCNECRLCAEQIVCFVPWIKGRDGKGLTALRSRSITIMKCVHKQNIHHIDERFSSEPSRLPIALFKINQSKSRWSAADWLDTSSWNYSRCDKHLIKLSSGASLNIWTKNRFWVRVGTASTIQCHIAFSLFKKVLKCGRGGELAS